MKLKTHLLWWKDSTYYGISEWIKHPARANIPVEEYMAEARNFNPVNFDALAIAKLAKDAGMKYYTASLKEIRLTRVDM